MKRVNVLLNSIEAVRKFVDTVSIYDCDMDMMTGNYVVDAKSIMGIFSMNLLHPLEFRIYDDSKKADDIIHKIRPYIIKPEY